MRNFKKHIGLFSIIILVFIVAYTAYFINKNNIANQSFIVNKQNISFSSLPSNFNDYKILKKMMVLIIEITMKKAFLVFNF